MLMLVAGGAGFIGSNFVKYALSKSIDLNIINLDLLVYSGRLENLQGIIDDPRHKFIHGDIRDRKTVEKIIKEGVDVIVNFAAETHVDRSIVDADSFILTDVYGNFILLDTSRKYDVKRYIHISTDEVYGSIERGSSKESDPLNPSSPYSASKAAGDLIVKAFYKTYGIPVIITRSSNNFGPFQHPEKLIPKLIIRALTDQHLPLYGDGKQIRDWIYVIDNCEAINLIIEKGKFGEVYNVASKNEITNLEIAELVLKTLNKPRDLIKFVKDRPGHDYRYSLDISKIRNFGWKPNHKFEEALTDTIRWYKNNPWWWKQYLEDDFFRLDTPWSRKESS
jgi:dTDP-glucose 4,6-dehydratase